ncbi:hypothetical protein AMTR_s00055p00185330 [Amborella trichopoda]|uniref:Uncharacterized protein n=1 Tax=Amborella trichopoda TaxID=13333 RepID=U5DA62_AMBTC|nr:hypothetical protein AMTR_s00055p00185330 [Amborella trichopoda]
MIVSHCVARNEDNGGSNCKGCITNHFDHRCPLCRPVLRCVAGCLWNGISKSKCVKTCNSRKRKPRLEDCKRCMASCKCSCVT